MIDAVIVRTATDRYRWALRLDGDVVATSVESWEGPAEVIVAFDVMLKALNWRRAR